MTSPGESAPDGAYVVGAPGDYGKPESEIVAQWSGRVGSGFVAGQGTWASRVGQVAGDIVSGAVGFVMSGFATVADAIGDFVGGLLGALFGNYGGSDPKMVEVQTFFENQGTIISDKAYYAEIPASAPLWGSANPLEDCTFPRVLLNRVAKPEVRMPGTGNNAYLEKYRTGSYAAFDSYNGQLLRTTNFSGSMTNTIRFGLIRSDRSRTYSTVSVMLGPKLSENAVYVGVYRMDMETGDFVAHWRSPNITPTVTMQQSEVRLSFPPVITQKADIWAVAILQTGNNAVNAVRAYANLITEHVEAPPLVYPPRQNARILSTSALPATATRNALDFTGNEYGTADLYAETLIWASLGEAPNPDEAVLAKYAETFGSRLGSWATTGPEFGMPGGYVTHHRLTDGMAGALWVSPTSTDDMVLEGRQATKTKNFLLGEEQGPPTSRWQRLIARCSPDFRQGAACEWTNSQLRVITWNTDYANSGSSYTLAGSVARTVKAGDRVRFAIKGTTATVWLNDVQVLTCPISTPTGARYRHVGFGTSRSDWTSSGGFSAWSAADIEEDS